MNSIKYLGLDIKLDDTPTWDYLCKAKNLKGLFQLETHSAQYVLGRIKPRNIEDLSVVNATNRPGAMSFIDEIADIRNGDKQPTYIHEALEAFLKETYGKLIYQEQVMHIAQKLANFKAKESNALLKALGKKEMDVMKAQKEAFQAGMAKNGFTPDVSEQIFQWFEAFANYSFNKSHSVSYSIMGYISAYVKLHYPLQFYSSLLNYAQYEQKPIEEISEIVSEFESFNIKILPPSIDKLDNKFKIEDGGIRYPIGLIKGMAELSFEKLKTISETQTKTLDSCLEALVNTGLNSRIIEFIIISGALDKFGVGREEILFYYWFLSELKEDVLQNFWVVKNGTPFSRELIFSFLEYRQVVEKKAKKKQLTEEEKLNEKIRYKSHFKTEITRTKTLAKIQEYQILIDEYKKNIPLAKFFWETHVLGFAFNYKFNASVKTFSQLDSLTERESGVSCGLVQEFEHKTSAKGKKWGRLTIKFDKNQAFSMFDGVYERGKDLIKDGDLVRFTVVKTKKGMNVDSIKIINDIRNTYEFYNNHERK